MAIERDPPFFWDVSCDECQDLLEPRPDTEDAPTFKDVVAYVKEQGWKVRFRNGAWEHICALCQEPPDLDKEW